MRREVPRSAHPESPPAWVEPIARGRAVRWAGRSELSRNEEAGLAVFDDDIVLAQGTTIRDTLPMRDIGEVRVRPVVGGCLLQARRGSSWVDLLAFPHRDEARMLDAVAAIRTVLGQEAGEPITREPPASRDGSSDFRLVLRFLSPYRGLTIAMMVLLVVGIGLDLVSPLLTRFLVDDVLPGSATAARALGTQEVAGREGLLFQVVLVLVLVQLLRMLVNIGNGWIAAWVGTGLTADLRKKLVIQLQRLPIEFYRHRQVGSLVGRVAYDTEAMHDLVWQITGGFLLQLVMVIGVFAMMFTIDAQLAVMALLPAPLVVGGTIFYWRYVYPRYFRTWDASAQQAGALSNILQGIRIVKAFGQEDRESARFAGESMRLREARRRLDVATALFNPVVGVVFQLGGWLVWSHGGGEVLRWRLTLGELMAFFGYLWMFYGPLASLPQLSNWLSRFSTQASRIAEILGEPSSEGSDPPAAIEMGTSAGALDLDRVTFSYDHAPPVLRGLDLHVAPGTTVGMVGASGSGKSTMVSLLQRFYEPDGGVVRLDGVDIRRHRLRDLRRNVAVVLQEPYLFVGTVWDNVAYGRPDADPTLVIDAAARAACHDFVLTVHRFAYDSWLGERGAGLSGGERQRVGLARTLLLDPRVLVVDESTSNLDARTETLVRAALADRKGKRTTLIVAHRLAALREVDRIVVLDRGRIVEDGTHDALVSSGGLYAEMVRLQGSPALEHVEPGTVRWLRPEADRELLAPLAEGRLDVLPCRPLSLPEECLSVRTREGEEIGLLRRLSDWPADVQQWVRTAIDRRTIYEPIEAIRKIRLEHDQLEIDVRTPRGERSFSVAWSQETIRLVPPSGRLFIDKRGDHWVLPDVRALSRPERSRLGSFVELRSEPRPIEL
jgi:ATP-binding cassette subfamily B protein